MKHVAHLVFIGLVALAFFLLMVFVEQDLALYWIVVPPANVTLEEWLDSFELWATCGIVISLLASIGWYALGQWGYNISTWKETDKRPIWWLFFLISLIGVALGMLLAKRAQEGMALAYLFYFINGALSFYLETALFSPLSFKYTPIGASKIRRWNLSSSSQTDRD